MPPFKKISLYLAIPGKDLFDKFKLLVFKSSPRQGN